MRAVLALIGYGMLAATAHAQEPDPQRGAELFRACVACHALEEGLHLSGPSLGGLYGRAVGRAEGYVRYSDGLKEADFAWDEAALDGWIENPEAMFPGTFMSFRGISSSRDRADLVAFLMIATNVNTAGQALEDGLVPEKYLRGPAPPVLADVPPTFKVTSIRHCGDSYFVTTADGRSVPYWEKNVRLKIDSAETGPPPNTTVILGSGMQGDRVSVIFSSVDHLVQQVKEKC